MNRTKNMCEIDGESKARETNDEAKIDGRLVVEKICKISNMAWLRKSNVSPSACPKNRDFYCRFEEDKERIMGRGGKKNKHGQNNACNENQNNTGNNRGQKKPQNPVPGMEGYNPAHEQRTQPINRQNRFENTAGPNQQSRYYTEEEYNAMIEKAIEESKQEYNNQQKKLDDPCNDYWEKRHHNLPEEPEIPSDRNNNASKDSPDSSQNDQYASKNNASAVVSGDESSMPPESSVIFDKYDRINNRNEAHLHMGRGARKKEPVLIQKYQQQYSGHGFQSNAQHNPGGQSRVPNRTEGYTKPPLNDRHHWTNPNQPRNESESPQPSTSKFKQIKHESARSESNSQKIENSSECISPNQNFSILKRPLQKTESADMLEFESHHLSEFNSRTKSIKEIPPLMGDYRKNQPNFTHEMHASSADEQFYDAVSDPTNYIAMNENPFRQRNMYEEADLDDLYKALSIHDPSLFRLLLQTGRIQISRPKK